MEPAFTPTGLKVCFAKCSPRSALTVRRHAGSARDGDFEMCMAPDDVWYASGFLLSGCQLTGI